MKFNGRKFRFALWAFLVLSLLLLETGCQEHDGSTRSFEGTYRNVPFGYSIEIPQGMRCRSASAYGCVIELGSPQDRVDIGGGFSPVADGMGELIDVLLSRVREIDPEASMVTRDRITLGKLPADRFRIVWSELGEKRVEESVIAIGRSPDDSAAVAYRIRFRCGDERLRDCESAFERVVRSFQVGVMR